MSRSWMLGSAVLVGLLAGQTEAHFVWVGIGRFQPKAEIYFNEQPQPGEPHLLDRIKQTQAWVRTPDGRQRPLKLQVTQGPAKKADAVLISTSPLPQPPRSVEAFCHYGVFKRGPQPRLLTYYAKHLDLQPGDPHWAALARSPSLDLDIEPQPANPGMTFVIWWQGRPAAGAEVVFYAGADESEPVKTDANGRVQWTKSTAGLAVRARVLEADRRGKLNDQPYDGALHYSTLTMSGTSAAATSQQPAGQQTSATEPVRLDAPAVLKRARDARAVWKDFPGFRARMSVAMAGYEGQGDLTVKPDGTIQLAGFPPGGDLKQPEDYLDSLVQHRLSDAGADENVQFVNENERNPLGRLIRFNNDERLKSTYRVQDDFITEVNREIGDTRFSISVLAVHWTEDGKYLPEVFNVGYWKKPSGTLERTETHVNHWVRVGQFELPKHISVLRDTHGGGSLMVLKLSEHVLGTQEPARPSARQ